MKLMVVKIVGGWGGILAALAAVDARIFHVNNKVPALNKRSGVLALRTINETLTT